MIKTFNFGFCCCCFFSSWKSIQGLINYFPFQNAIQLKADRSAVSYSKASICTLMIKNNKMCVQFNCCHCDHNWKIEWLSHSYSEQTFTFIYLTNRNKVSIWTLKMALLVVVISTLEKSYGTKLLSLFCVKHILTLISEIRANMRIHEMKLKTVQYIIPSHCYYPPTTAE